MGDWSVFSPWGTAVDLPFFTNQGPDPLDFLE